MKCGKVFLLALLSGLLFAPFGWADPLEKIEQARSLLIPLGQSFEQRATDLDERERISRQTEQNLNERESAIEQREQSSTATEQRLNERETSINERETVLPRMQESLQTLTDSYTKQAKSLKAARISRNLWRVAAVAAASYIAYTEIKERL